MKKLIITGLSLIIVIITVICANPVSADNNFKAVSNNQTHILNREKYLHNFWQIPVKAGKEVFTSDEKKLKRNLIFSGVLLGTFHLDQSIRDFTQNQIYSGDNLLSRFLYNIGTKKYGLAGFAGAYGVSKLTENQYLEDTVLLSFQSILLTQISTEIFRHTVRRVRPRYSPHDPFLRKDEGHSFISGHASGTWAVSTVIADRYPEKKWLAYTLAAAVAVSRIYEDAHWASDVLMGSAVGYGFGRLTLELNEFNEKKYSLTPAITDNTLSAFLRVNF